MAEIISIANMKGGVGKTTLCVSLAECLCYLGKTVLIIDLDAQTNSSQILWGIREGNPWKDGPSIHSYLCQILSGAKADCFPYIKRNIILSNRNKGAVSLFSSSPQLFLLERENLSKFKRGIDQLQAMYDQTFEAICDRESENFDYIIVDCPPGISLITEAALKQSDIIIMPTSPNFLSTMGVQAFTKFLERNSKASRFVFINQVNTNARTMARYRTLIRQEEEKGKPRYSVFRNHYPIRVALQRAMERYDGKPFETRYGQSAFLVKNVTEELMEFVNGRPFTG